MKINAVCVALAVLTCALASPKVGSAQVTPPAEQGDAAQPTPTTPKPPATTPTAPIQPETAAAIQTPTAPTEPSRGVFSPLSDKLQERGVSLRGVLIDQYATNTEGGVRQGNTDVGQLNFGADVNLQKAVGLAGASFHFTIYRDFGNGLAKDVTGTFFKQQNIYKNEFTQLHLGLFAFEEKLFSGKLDLIAGRLGTTSYYGHIVPGCDFQAGTTCGIPVVLNSQAGFGLLPSATWGGNISYKPTKHTYIETGAFEVNPYIAHTNGLDWSTAHANGVTIPVEVAYADSSLKARRYPFELKGGFYLSTAPRSDPYYNTRGGSVGLTGTARTVDANRTGVYLLGDRVVWRPDPANSQNLNVFGGVVQPLELQETIRRQVYGGAVLTGTFPRRSQDTVGFSATYLQLTPREVEFLRDARLRAGGSGVNDSNEFAFELNYGIEIAPHLKLMPNVQYVVNPDNSAIPRTPVLPKNLLTFGLALNFGFSSFLGFAGPGGGSD